MTVVGTAAAGSTWIADVWWLLLQGIGLAAASFLGPFVATRGAPGTRHARVAGALAGAGLFAVITAAASWLGPLLTSPAAVVIQYPALAAAPAAWLVAALARAGARHPRAR